MIMSGNDYIIQNSSILFPYLCIIFLTLALLLAYSNIQEKVIIILLGTVVMIIYHMSVLKGLNKDKSNLVSFKTEEGDIQDIEFVLPKVFKFHNKPRRFIYIYHNQHIMEILNDMAFIKRYDDASYEKLIILMEGYLKLYYGILDGKYINTHYFSMMIDLRNEILSIFQQLFFNVPIASKTHRRNLHEAIEKNMLKIQSITFHHMKIISRKCKTESNVDLLYEPPYPMGIYENQMTIY